MIDRLIPIFAVVGFVSCMAYVSLIVWVLYSKWGHFASKLAVPAGKKPVAVAKNKVACPTADVVAHS